jgi:threonyl-tRNA synthetase
MLVVGDQEVAAGTAAPRLRDGTQLEPVDRDRLVTLLASLDKQSRGV